MHDSGCSHQFAGLVYESSLITLYYLHELSVFHSCLFTTVFFHDMKEGVENDLTAMDSITLPLALVILMIMLKFFL